MDESFIPYSYVIQAMVFSIIRPLYIEITMTLMPLKAVHIDRTFSLHLSPIIHCLLCTGLDIPGILFLLFSRLRFQTYLQHIHEASKARGVYIEPNTAYRKQVK